MCLKLPTVLQYNVLEVVQIPLRIGMEFSFVAN